MHAKSRIKTAAITALMVTTLLVMAACGSQPAASSQAASSAASAQKTQSTSAKSANVDTDAEYDKALSGNGLVNGFIGEKFYDGTIETDEQALAAAESALPRVGGDSTTKLELTEIRPTETGTTYYAFRQQAGEVVVNGAAVKLIVDKDKHVAGLVSSILPNIQLENLESWEVTQQEAEQAVTDELASSGNGGVKIIQDATEQTLIPLSDDSNDHRYAWVVYTNNYLHEYEAAYLAHYVNAAGEYLYALPVAEPSNADSLAGDAAAFAFDKMQPSTWTGTVTKHDGTTVELTVPTLTDTDNGNVILGDGERKIVCMDYADFSFNKTISPRIAQDGKFADNEVLVYDTFIKVWDFYAGVGWTGPDGNGTPTGLLMDLVEESGEVIHNARYSGRQWGFQTFSFNRDEADGECYDVVGHEFTHCVTSTLLISSLYRNDGAAIDEGMSDVMGNLIEMLVAYNPDGAWLFGENEASPMRSQKDPHSINQPEFVWDTFYGPAVTNPTDANDRGGAHVNSSLLSHVSYKLDQAGMAPEDQFYFWMNVDMAMTPSTDFPQLTELLPWCMTQAGYPQFVDTIKQAVEAGRFTTTTAPAEPPAGCGYVKLTLPDKMPVSVENVCFSIAQSGAADDSVYSTTWAGTDQRTILATLPAGDYVIRAQYLDGSKVTTTMMLTEAGWTSAIEGTAQTDAVFTIKAGETVELPANGLES